MTPEKDRKRRWWQRRPKPEPGYDHCVPAASHTCDECKRVLPDPPTWLPPGHVFAADAPGPRPDPIPARPDEVFPPVERCAGDREQQHRCQFTATDECACDPTVQPEEQDPPCVDHLAGCPRRGDCPLHDIPPGGESDG